MRKTAAKNKNVGYKKGNPKPRVPYKTHRQRLQTNDNLTFSMNMTCYTTVTTLASPTTPDFHFNQYGFPINYPGFFMESDDGTGTLPTAYKQLDALPDDYSNFFGGGVTFDLYRVRFIKVTFVPQASYIDVISSPATVVPNDQRFLMYWYIDHDDINPLSGGPTTIEGKFMNEGRVPRTMTTGKPISHTWYNPFKNHWFNCAGINLAPGDTATILADSVPPNPFKSLRIGIGSGPTTIGSPVGYQGRIYVKYSLIFKGLNMAQ